MDCYNNSTPSPLARFPNLADHNVQLILKSTIVELCQAFCVQSHSVFRDYSDMVHFSYEDPARLGMQIAFGRVHRKTAPTGPPTQ